MNWLEAPDGETILEMTWPTVGGETRVVFRLGEGQLWLLSGVEADEGSALRGSPVADATEPTNDPLETLHLLYAAHPVLVHGEQALDAARQAVKDHDPLEVAASALRIAATPAACLALSRALEDEADPELLGALAVRILGQEVRLREASLAGGKADSRFTPDAGLPHIRKRDDVELQREMGRDWRNAFTVELVERLCTWARSVTDDTLEATFQPTERWEGGMAAVRAGAAAGLRSSDRNRRIRALENIATAAITPKGWERREELAQARREAAEALAEKARKARQQRGRPVATGFPPWAPVILGLLAILVLLRLLFG